MLRSILMLTATASLLCAASGHADVYMYKDASGNVQYTDKPPTLPAERLNVQSQRTDKVAIQARQEEAAKRAEEANKTRAQTNASQPAKLNPNDKADRCAQAKQQYDAYMTTQRLYETLPNGERRYLSAEELDATRASAKASMDVMCK